MGSESRHLTMVRSGPATMSVLRWFVAIAGGLVGCAAAVWLVLWISLRSSAVRVPEVRGMEISHGAGVLRESGLLVRIQEGVFDALVPIGRIAQQRPAPGFQLKRGSTVLLLPSLGTEARRVGELVGLPVSLAEAELENEGLTVGSRCEVEEQADAVVVLAQTPPGGTLVAPSAGVALLVNRLPQRTTYVMPDFVGMSEPDATRIIRQQGFRLAEVQRVPYAGAPAGVVLRQDPPGGGPVADAAVVGLWVSR
jgi:eukaryotic-like serine/threonine-protein kinase